MFRPAAQVIAVVIQETRLKGLEGRWATKSAAKFVLRKARQHFVAGVAPGAPQVRAAKVANEEQALFEADFDLYEAEDAAYRRTLDELRRQLDLGLPVQIVDRDFLPNYNFEQCVAVVVLGRDGLVANVAKYVGDVPIVGVNPDPQRIDGVLLPFRVDGARRGVQQVLERREAINEVTLAEARLNDGQTMLAFNDFFVGCQSHVSARYILRAAGRAEPQSSSGVIVSTGAGSTGWLSSLFNMMEGFAEFAGGTSGERQQLAWGDKRLIWAVREPFRSKYSSAELVAGVLDDTQALVVESLMPERGVIFSDGVESDFLEFNSGVIATIGISRRRARLVVDRNTVRR